MPQSHLSIAPGLEPGPPVYVGRVSAERPPSHGDRPLRGAARPGDGLAPARPVLHGRTGWSRRRPASTGRRTRTSRPGRGRLNCAARGRPWARPPAGSIGVYPLLRPVERAFDREVSILHDMTPADPAPDPQGGDPVALPGVLLQGDRVVRRGAGGLALDGGRCLVADGDRPVADRHGATRGRASASAATPTRARPSGGRRSA